MKRSMLQRIKHKHKTGFLVLLIAGAFVSVMFQTRAFLPSFGSYTTRLQTLKGWSSRGYYGFNCSGFLARAHGEQFLTEQQMYQGDGVVVVKTFPGLRAINEAELIPGDIAAFAGPTGVGLHVSAYLGNGTWIDSDSRRGGVATYRLVDEPASDEWFQGKVHIVRWSGNPRSNFAPRFFDREQAVLAE